MVVVAGNGRIGSVVEVWKNASFQGCGTGQSDSWESRDRWCSEMIIGGNGKWGGEAKGGWGSCVPRVQIRSLGNLLGFAKRAKKKVRKPKMDNRIPSQILIFPGLRILGGLKERRKTEKAGHLQDGIGRCAGADTAGRAHWEWPAADREDLRILPCTTFFGNGLGAAVQGRLIQGCKARRKRAENRRASPGAGRNGRSREVLGASEANLRWADRFCISH